MKTTGILSAGIIILAAILFVLQLWFELFTGAQFFKIMVTLTVLLVVIVGVALIRREYISENAQRKKRPD